MKKLLLIIFLFTLSCSLNKVKNNHGVLSLENKFNKIYVNKSNAPSGGINEMVRSFSNLAKRTH